MTKTRQEVAVSAKDMKLDDLKLLAVQLEIFSAEQVSKLKKAELLKAITAYEKKAVADSKVLLDEQDTYEGKKVISRTPREINGKQYEDILVESGETFTDPVALTPEL